MSSCSVRLLGLPWRSSPFSGLGLLAHGVLASVGRFCSAAAELQNLSTELGAA